MVHFTNTSAADHGRRLTVPVFGEREEYACIFFAVDMLEEGNLEEIILFTTTLEHPILLVLRVYYFSHYQPD